MTSTKYVIVKNHVRELPEKYNLNNTSENETFSSESGEKTPIKKTAKKKLSNSSEAPVRKRARIDSSDLNELKTVYNQIKAILAKIECKYSHLLEIGETEDHKSNEICVCHLNQKTVFNNDGSSTTQKNEKCHICTSKKTRLHQDSTRDKHNNDKLVLPDEVNSLLNILRDPHIAVTFRNKVIYKLKGLKQEEANAIRFYKQYLKEKALSEPDELIHFNGSNLSSLSGYK